MESAIEKARASDLQIIQSMHVHVHLACMWRGVHVARGMSHVHAHVHVVVVVVVVASRDNWDDSVQGPLTVYYYTVCLHGLSRIDAGRVRVTELGDQSDHVRYRAVRAEGVLGIAHKHLVWGGSSHHTVLGNHTVRRCWVTAKLPKANNVTVPCMWDARRHPISTLLYCVQTCLLPRGVKWGACVLPTCA